VSAGAIFLAAIWVAIVWLIVGAWRVARRRVTPGTAFLVGMERLFDDRRRAAIEVIVDERTGYRDPENKEGTTPRRSRIRARGEHGQTPDRVGDRHRFRSRR
jgi:hypothetical protein